MLWLGSPAKEARGTGAIAVYKYNLKNRPYTDIIIMKDNTVMNRPPMSVTAHNGMLSQKLQFSMACTMVSGKTDSVVVPKPALLMMVEIIPCAMSNSAIISSSP
ncbi:MAG: hypothetical protein BWX99_02035 [Deltaproteobacteria bacterium ADurb.Bin151]|nr:MAG: hypothetical protein BWX99_02035 [Deltaproteobacteria bacterium ADurb.Bin151]